MNDTLDPEEFVDRESVFSDDYNPGEITYATFEVAPGGEVPAAVLKYRRGNNYGPRARTETREWSIDMYGPGYNGDAIPIDDRDARYVLENMYGEDLEAVDWAAHHDAEFE